MKEIKFRVWDKENKKMQYPENFIFNQDWSYSTNWSAWENIKFDDKKHITSQNKGEIMQYTGLQDKTGRDIFEGDIIEAYEFIQKPKMVVKFDEEMAGFIPFIWKQSLEYEDYIGYFAYENSCIVIGNIYENPELLDNK